MASLEAHSFSALIYSKERPSNLHCPLGQLAAVVPKLVGQHGTALGVELLPPLNAVGQLEVSLIQRHDR